MAQSSKGGKALDHHISKGNVYMDRDKYNPLQTSASTKPYSINERLDLPSMQQSTLYSSPLPVSIGGHSQLYTESEV